MDVGVGVVVEAIFEPVAGFKIEVIGGVSNSRGWVLREEFGERDASAAGELFGFALPVFFSEA